MRTVDNFPRLSEDLDEAIRLAIESQLRHDIKLLTDGEQRDDILTGS